MADIKILVAGESWIKHISHIKGFDIFTSCEYETGITWLREALEKQGISVTHMPGHEVQDSFPISVKSLNSYDAVVLSDIGANSLLLSGRTFSQGKIAPDRCGIIKEYVAKGGAFCMIGGYLSFSGIDGKARYGKSAIADILPVKILDGDDRVEKPEGIVPEVVRTDHPVMKDLPSPWPHFLGYNQTLQGEGEILMKAGEDPFVAVRNYEKGRTAAFASDCAPHWGPLEFLNWQGYGLFWGNLFRWLAKATN